MKKFVKVLWIIEGVALIIGGCCAFFNPMAGFMTFQGICAISLLISGISSILAYIASHRVLLGAGWILSEGIITTILGALLLTALFYDGIIAKEIMASFAVVLSVILALWLAFYGVTHLTRSFDLHKLGASGWGWGTIWGIICIVCAIAVFCKPVVSAIGTTSFIMGLILIIGGISSISRCLTRDIED